MIAKIKLNETFPDSQFKIPGMEKPYCLDVTANRWGVGRDVFFSKLLRTDIQAILYEIKTNNRRLLKSSYRHPKQILNYFFSCISDLKSNF